MRRWRRGARATPCSGARSPGAPGTGARRGSTATDAWWSRSRVGVTRRSAPARSTWSGSAEGSRGRGRLRGDGELRLGLLAGVVEGGVAGEPVADVLAQLVLGLLPMSVAQLLRARPRRGGGSVGGALGALASAPGVASAAFGDVAQQLAGERGRQQGGGQAAILLARRVDQAPGVARVRAAGGVDQQPQQPLGLRPALDGVLLVDVARVPVSYTHLR